MIALPIGKAIFSGGLRLLPFTDSFTRADGAIGNGWTGATWTIATNKAVNTPSLGSELYLTGDFAADANWTKGTGWTIAAGVASHSGNSGLISQNVTTAQRWYRQVWTLQNRTSGTYKTEIGNTQLTAAQSVNGTYTESGRSTSSSNSGVVTNSPAIGDIDNLSLKQYTTADLFVSRDFRQADVDASVNAVIVLNNPCGLVLNLDSTSSPANYVQALHDGTNAQLLKCVAGVFTSLISTAATYVAGATIRLTKSGTTYTLYYNAVAISTPQTISDASIVSNTRHGMFNTYELNTLDDFSIPG